MEKRCTARCPDCGTLAALAGDDGRCPGCLLASALDISSGDPADDDSPPAECGGYLLEREIGRGGTGVVFLARLPGNPRAFALKMPAARFAGPEEIRRFRFEVESITGLDHPNIIRVHSSGEEDGRPYFVMSHAASGSLQAVLDQRGGRVQASRRRPDVEWMAKVALAVHFAHERGVLHRDIKPANILLDENDEPLVSDFGLARMIHSPSANTLTGSAIGTPAYMSPEQAAGGAVTTATDVYSLGAVLYHLLTGQPPFDGGTPLETLRRLTAEDPRDPRELAPDLDRDLATICLKCLQRDPVRRYPGAAAFSTDLRSWLHGEPVLARPVGTGERLLKWSRRHPALGALAGSTCVAALVITGLLVSGSSMLRKERNEALQQEAKARRSEIRANATAEAFRQNAYAADIYLASRAIEDGQLGVARRMLDRHLPGPDGSDSRGFEWHALSHRSKGTDSLVLRDHRAAVTAVAFDPTGKWLASAGRDGTLVIRSVDEWKTILTLPRKDAPAGPGEIPLMARLTARSPEAASALLRLALNPDEIRMRARPARLGEFSAIAWSPDGTLLATGSTGAYVRLWSVPKGEMIAFLPMTMVEQIAFSDDGELLASLVKTENHHDLRIHRVDDLHPIRTLRNVEPAFAIAGGKLAVISKDKTAFEISDMASGEILETWQADSGIHALAFTAGTEKLVGVDHLRSRWIEWSTSDGLRIREKSSGSESINALAVSADDGTVLTGGTGQSLSVSATTGGNPDMALAGHEDEILSISLSGDKRWIASGSIDKTVRIWRNEPGKPAKPASAPTGLKPVAISPDGLTWLSSSASGGVFICGITGDPVEVPGSPDLHPLEFDPTGTRFLTWRQKDGVALFEWRDSRSLDLLETRGISVPMDPPLKIISGGGGRRCAITAHRLPVRVHDLKNGALLHEFPVPEVLVDRMVFSPDAELLLVSSWPREIQIGKMGENWRDRVTLSWGTVGPMVFSPDSRWIACGADDNRIIIRETLSGQTVQELSGHRSRIDSLAFTPDGATLASSAGDMTLRLWHTKTWRDLGKVDGGGTSGVLSFGPDASHLLVIPNHAPAVLIPGKPSSAPAEDGLEN